MTDRKPERLGKLEKPPRKFAPKRPVKREPKSADQEVAAAPQGDAAGPSGGAQGHDDPFAALMEQAKAVVKSERNPHGHRRKDSKFNVAFGGGAEDLGLGDLKQKLIKGDAAKAGAGKAAADGSGAGKAAAGTSATATKKDVLGRQDEDMELLEDIHKNAQADKQRAPLFDRQAYYPTVVPFVPVDVPHDPNAIMHDTGVPPDLAEQEPEEPNSADDLGLENAPDGHLLLLQLPPVLPSVPLFEAAQRAALEDPAPVNGQPLPEGSRPLPKFAVGPDVLKQVPSGRIGSLVLTKSGKVRLQIGCAKFDVTAGVGAQHRSELHLLNLKTKDIVLAATDLPSAVAALDLSSIAPPSTDCPTV